MTREEKRTIFVLIILGIVIIGGLLIWRNNIEKKNNNVNIVNNGDIVTEEYVQKLEDGSKLNISEELQKTKTLNGLEISNIQLREIGGITTLLANVENKTGMQTYSKMVKVDILDKAGNTITSLKGIIDGMPVGGKVQLNIAVTVDVANAYNFRISNQ